MFARLGEQSAYPPSYWNPALGHWCGVRAGDIGGMSPAQLVACLDFIDAATAGG